MSPFESCMPRIINELRLLMSEDKITILNVDDDPICRFVTPEILKLRGYNIL